MYLAHRDQRWFVAAPAKINLTLEVLGRRTDGYHDIETLIAPVSLYDGLSVRSGAPGSGGQVSLTIHDRVDRRGRPSSVDGPLPSDERNLVVRAVRLLGERSGVDHGAEITLTKRIPWQAGLGGGSSDAAAALVATARAWGVDWSRERLAQLGAQLGSDVPAFFAQGATICRGRGEQVEAVRVPLGLPLVIVKPPVGLSTPRVFAAASGAIAPAAGFARRMVEALRSGSLKSLRSAMHNALAVAAQAVEPSLRELKQMFDALPLVAHQLTGSGSAWIGVCRSMTCARRMAQLLAARGCGATYAVHTCL